jgi:hypothetical protein
VSHPAFFESRCCSVPVGRECAHRRYRTDAVGSPSKSLIVPDAISCPVVTQMRRDHCVSRDSANRRLSSSSTTSRTIENCATASAIGT